LASRRLLAGGFGSHHDVNPTYHTTRPALRPVQPRRTRAFGPRQPAIGRARLGPGHPAKMARSESAADIRIDDTEIPGIRPTLGYLDLRQHTIEEVADLAAEKILSTASPVLGASPGGKTIKTGTPLRARNLQIKKEFTELERDTFLEEAFEEIARSFEASLANLTAEHPGIVGRFRRVNANHFTALVYRNGSTVSKCGIRLGGLHGHNQISYSDDPNSTNSMNDSVSVEDDTKSLFLKPGYSSMFGGKKSKSNLSPQEAAEMFWERLLAPLER